VIGPLAWSLPEVAVAASQRCFFGAGGAAAAPGGGWWLVVWLPGDCYLWPLLWPAAEDRG